MKNRGVLAVLVVTPLSVAYAACKEWAPAKPGYALQPVPLAQVEISDAFWTPRMETNQRVSIWHCFRKFEETSAFDSPKLVEAAAYMLAKGRDAELEAHIDADIEKLVADVEPPEIVNASCHCPGIPEGSQHARIHEVPPHG